PVGDVWRPQMREALQTGEMVRQDVALGIPIVVRGRVIGVIDAKKPDGLTWTADEIEMITNLSEQLNVALDSARLYQETQRRESEQRLIGEVTSEMRRTLDIESMLQTAIREIGDALNLARVEVRMGQVEPQGGEGVQ
ncbi:MAG: GAF domain-containing protein, partial [Anaerolineae bacterium]|nr:GAF domain-containing protein [Anaerolineae bacterium]